MYPCQSSQGRDCIGRRGVDLELRNDQLCSLPYRCTRCELWSIVPLLGIGRLFDTDTRILRRLGEKKAPGTMRGGRSRASVHARPVPSYRSLPVLSPSILEPRARSRTAQSFFRRPTRESSMRPATVTSSHFPTCPARDRSLTSLGRSVAMADSASSSLQLLTTLLPFLPCHCRSLLAHTSR